MTEYVYGTERREIGTRTFKNARFFQALEADATHVVVIGDYPKIVAAYRAAGVPVDAIPVGSRIPNPLPVIPPSLAQSIVESQAAPEAMMEHSKEPLAKEEEQPVPRSLLRRGRSTRSSHFAQTEDEGT
jgi:hypothetical protein